MALVCVKPIRYTQSVLSRISGEQDMVSKSPSAQFRLADRGVGWHTGHSAASLRFGYFIQHEMVIAVVEALAVIGFDFLRGHRCILDIQKGTLAVRGKVHTCWAMPSIFRISTTETVMVQPLSVMYIPRAVQGEAHFTEGMVEGTCSPLCEGNIVLSKIVVIPIQGNLPLRVANLSNEPKTLFKGMEVITCESVDVLPVRMRLLLVGVLISPKDIKHICWIYRSTWNLWWELLYAISLMHRHKWLKSYSWRSWIPLQNCKKTLELQTWILTGWRWLLHDQWGNSQRLPLAQQMSLGKWMQYVGGPEGGTVPGIRGPWLEDWPRCWFGFPCQTGMIGTKLGTT